MEKRRFGKTGIEVSALGFGAAESGLRGAPLAILLGKAHDAGVNVIDTAPCYGQSEELIGRATQCWRKHFYILTKCGHAAGLDLADWTPELVEKSIERSLRRLRTDYLDVVQLHSCGEAELRQGDLVEALKRAKDKGMARYVGYSGDGRAALYAARCGAFDTLQISINLADQEAIDLVLPIAIENDLGVIAKRPIANAAWLGLNFIRPYRRAYWPRLRRLGYDFLRSDPRKTPETTLRFTLSVPGVHTASSAPRNLLDWTRMPRSWRRRCTNPSTTRFVPDGARWRRQDGWGWDSRGRSHRVLAHTRFIFRGTTETDESIER
jgi:diketogulonate reductase-like aldo/keto reductase